jgi:hypothetical protein
VPGGRVGSQVERAKGIINMPDWIAKANIDHFKKLLETEKDPQRRAMIERELAEEQAKLTELLKNRGERKEN